MNVASDKTPENISPNTENSYFIENDKHNINMYEHPETKKLTNFKVPLETTNNKIMYKTDNGVETNNMYIKNYQMSNSIDNNMISENYKYDLNNGIPIDMISRNNVNKANETYNANINISDINNKYSNLNSQDNNNTVSYNLNKNTGWNIQYPENTDPNMYMKGSSLEEKNMQPYYANYTNIPSKEMYHSNVKNTNLQDPTNQMNQTSHNYNQTVSPNFNNYNNMNKQNYPHLQKIAVHNNNNTPLCVNENLKSQIYNNPISPNINNFKMKQEMSSLYRRTNGYSTPIPNCNTYPETNNFMNFEKTPIPYMNNGVMSPASTQLYYLMKENNKECFLKKGMQSIMNVCNKNKKNEIPRYEYIVKGPSSYPSYPMYDDPKRFDIFKKLTLQVGTCLDDVVNLCIDTLGSSLKKFNNNNVVNLHDLYPFYNPDPIYSRPERPTLKTGNNFIDNINVTLDATTLEKHKNIPNGNSRIPIPRTQKTGFVVVDGVNNILDNLLNDPISYRKYDYFNDRVNGTEVSN